VLRCSPRKSMSRRARGSSAVWAASSRTGPRCLAAATSRPWSSLSYWWTMSGPSSGQPANQNRWRARRRTPRRRPRRRGSRRASPDKINCENTKMLVLPLIALVATGGGAEGLPLVRDGKPVAVVVLPAEPFPVARLAAEELVYHVEKATGARLE